MLKRILIAASLWLAASAPVWSQAGQFPSGWVQGNAGASPGQGKPNAVTAILDRALGSTRGAIIERGSTGWGIVGPSATAGLPWVSGGTGVDPAYIALGIVGGGTGCISASGTCLDNITGFSATTGYLTRTGAGTYAFSFPAFSQVTGSVACSQEPARTGVVTAPAGSCANVYPNANANTVLSNWGGSAAVPIFNTWPACANDGAHGLVYVNGTGLVCASLTTGGNVTNVGTPVANQIAQWTGATSIQGVNLVSLLAQGNGITITGTTTATISSQATSILMGGSGNANISNSVTNYSWASTVCVGATACQQPIATSGTISQLQVFLTATPGSGKSYTFFLMKNGVATAVTCAVVSTAQTCSDTSDSVTVAAGDLLQMQSLTPSGTPAAAGLAFSLQFVH